MENCALNGFFAPAQRARFLAAVSQRHSIRTYAGAPDVAQLSALNYAAARVCLPGVRIEIFQCVPEKLFRTLPFVDTIIGTDRCAAVIVDQNVPRAGIHAGVSGEAFVLEAVSLELAACWVAMFKRGGVDLPLAEGEKVAAVIPLGVPAEENTSRKRKKLTEICMGDPTAWPLWAYHAAECVRFAPSSMNRQPWKLAYAGRTLVLNKAGMGMDLDMGIALLHMSLGVGEKEHIIRWGEGKEIASLIAEDRI